MGRIRKTDRKELKPVQRAQIWARYCDGHGFTAISRLEKVPYSTMRSIIKRRLVMDDFGFETSLKTSYLKRQVIGTIKYLYGTHLPIQKTLFLLLQRYQNQVINLVIILSKKS